MLVNEALGLFLFLSDLNNVRLDIVPSINVSKVMVGLSMSGFISSNCQNYFSHLCVILQAVVLSGFLWSLHLIPIGQFAVVNLLQDLGIGVNGFFLEVTNESVAHFRSNQVGKEVGIEKDTLPDSNSESHRDSRIPHSQEEEQVHALILSLLKQVMDPTMVTLESSKATQVTNHATNHTGNASDSLQKDRSVHPVSLSHSLRVIS